MKSLFRYRHFGITLKLFCLNLMILIVFSVIISVMIMAFHNVNHLTDTIIDKNIRQVIMNAQYGRELSNLFDRTHLLAGTFYRNEDIVKTEKNQIFQKIKQLSDKTADENLKRAVNDFEIKLKLLFEQCIIINDIFRNINDIDNELGVYLENLEHTVSEKVIASVMDGKDTAVFDQLVVSLPLYREILLKIKIGFAELEPIRSYTRDVSPIIDLVSELNLKLRTLLASGNEITDYCNRLFKGLSEYNDSVIEFNTTVTEFRRIINDINRTKEKIITIMQQHEDEISYEFRFMREKTDKVIISSVRFVYLLSGLAIFFIGILTYIFFLVNIRRPMKLILQGLESIGDGNLDIKIRLERKDEWSIIEDAVNKMVSEVWHSYYELYHKNEELQKSEERLNRAQAVAHVGNWELDIPTKKMCGSNEAFKIYGLSRTTPFLPSEQIQNGIHSKDRQRLDESLNRLIHEDKEYDEIFRIYRADDNELRVIHSRAELLLDEKGNPMKVLGTVHDITELKKTEEELNKTRFYLNKIVDSMPSVLVGIDPGGYVTLWNIAAEKDTGISSEDAVGKLLPRAFSGYSRFLDEMMQSMNNKIPIIKEKIQKQNHSGDNGYLNMMIYPLVSNVVDGAVLRIDDVTEKVHIEEMMIQTEKMMSVGGLAAGMAHEINNPLGIILQSVQNTFRRLSPEIEANKTVADECGVNLDAVHIYLDKRGIFNYLNGIKDAGSRASKIVTNMLNFSRRSDSKMIASDINRLLDNTVELAANDYDLKKKYDFRSIEIIREYDPQLTQVICAPTEIEQVILNLLKNSAQAIAEMKEKRDDPKIILRTKKILKYAQIEVEDNGPGVDEKNRTRIFEPFYTTKTVGIGTGLGLSVSYFIITNNHKGTLTMESEQGKGAKFIIQLPLER